ncbi:MAG: carbamoyltransferase C-terminal domain-containing protein [Acidobacteriota bacterium]|jgi:carbamoyltransferase
MPEPWILGFSNSHNAAACLLRGPELVVAVQEERLCRVKRAELPADEMPLCVRYCLDCASLTPDDVDLVAGSSFPNDFQYAGWFECHWPDTLFVPHHLSHAYAVLVTSGFDEAAVLIIDGEGSPRKALPPEERRGDRWDAVTSLPVPTEIVSLYRATRDGIVPIEKHFGAAGGPTRADGNSDWYASLGGLFNAAGLRIFDDVHAAGKVMGLAPYGRPRFPLEDLVDLDPEGPLRFTGPERAPEAFASRVRPWPHDPAEHQDTAWACQAAFERAVVELARRLRRRSDLPRLCYAGGAALNGVANERIARSGLFDDLYVMPAAEDSGCALGAAYYARHLLGGGLPRRRVLKDSTGVRYTPAAVEAAVTSVPCIETLETELDRALDGAVELLIAGRIVGWFQGGSELGPRALGQRSILCDPRRPDAKGTLNGRVKFRESFRPFAPSTLREEVSGWFECEDETESPFMLRVMRFRPGLADRVPGVVHVDGTGRVQTVCRERDGLYHELIRRFHRETGVPMLLNTSFNVNEEPIVETPEDALWCLLFSGLDACFLEGRLVTKAACFRTVLDLSPEPCARLVGSTWTGRGRAEATVTLEASTPWGPVRHGLSAEEYTVYRLCDGRRTGREILETLTGHRVDLTPGPDGEQRITRILARLTRTRLLHLRQGGAPPEGRPPAQR